MVANIAPFQLAEDPGKLQEKLDSVLLDAAATDDIPALRRALAEGAHINARGDNNQTAMIRAAREGRLIMVEILLGAGASLDLQDRDGRTALSHATANGFTEIVSMLVRSGADITLDDKDGDKPLDIALRSGNPAMVAQFEQPLKDLLARIPSADTGSRLQYRRTPAASPDPHGDTMLTWAAREGQENVVRAMVQSGADVFVRNRAGHTPREVAEHAGHKLIVCMLEDAEERQRAMRAAQHPSGSEALPV